MPARNVRRVPGYTSHSGPGASGSLAGLPNAGPWRSAVPVSHPATAVHSPTAGAAESFLVDITGNARIGIGDCNRLDGFRERAAGGEVVGVDVETVGIHTEAVAVVDQPAHLGAVAVGGSQRRNAVLDIIDETMQVGGRSNVDLLTTSKMVPVTLTGAPCPVGHLQTGHATTRCSWWSSGSMTGASLRAAVQRGHEIR